MAAEPRKDNIDKNVKTPNIFERAKEKIETVLHHRRHKESHGLREDIDENTPLDDVKAPNVFERAKEEIEALAQTIHTKKENGSHEKRSDSAKEETKLEKKEDGVKAPNLIEKANEEIGSIIHKGKSPHHHHETHGMSYDIDDNTPIDEVKGPNIFERAKEEIEAIVNLRNNPPVSFPHERKKVGLELQLLEDWKKCAHQQRKVDFNLLLEEGWRKFALLGVTRKLNSGNLYPLFSLLACS